MRHPLHKSYVHERITALEASFILHSLSTSFVTSESTDVRDFVFALPGMAVECVANDDLLIPDYRKTPHEVLADVKRSLLHLRFPHVNDSVERGKRVLDIENSQWDMLQDFYHHLELRTDPSMSLERAIKIDRARDIEWAKEMEHAREIRLERQTDLAREIEQARETD